MGSAASNQQATGTVKAAAASMGGRMPSRKATSKQIDKELQKEKLARMNTFKILLLGGSECGKTTIFKQMRILHLDGFTTEDKNRYRQSILRNVIDSVAQMLKACETYRIVHEYVIQVANFRNNSFNTYCQKVFKRKHH
ncbi:unnamed protein product [Gongylonema pulchrum]|uniref:G-protein alpha subunit n=1 Tax=Gongylonema pulchrum TaxID=637853 RepID=A0A183CWF6_9BILA|nr:unnamed protein product [Gongylonema pulchrum]